MQRKYKIIFLVGLIFFVLGLIFYFVFSNEEIESIEFESPREVRIYFSNNILDPNFENCEDVSPVERTVELVEIPIGIDSQATVDGELIYFALSELLKGSTDEEIDDGFFTSINENTKIKHIIIKDNIAQIDFDSELEINIAGSCRVMAIRAQISRTVIQFDNIDDIVISVDGRKDDVLQP